MPLDASPALRFSARVRANALATPTVDEDTLDDVTSARRHHQVHQLKRVQETLAAMTPSDRGIEPLAASPPRGSRRRPPSSRKILDDLQSKHADALDAKQDAAAAYAHHGTSRAAAEELLRAHARVADLEQQLHTCRAAAGGSAHLDDARGALLLQLRHQAAAAVAEAQQYRTQLEALARENEGVKATAAEAAALRAAEARADAATHDAARAHLEAAAKVEALTAALHAAQRQAQDALRAAEAERAAKHRDVAAAVADKAALGAALQQAQAALAAARAAVRTHERGTYDHFAATAKAVRAAHAQELANLRARLEASERDRAALADAVDRLQEAGLKGGPWISWLHTVRTQAANAVTAAAKVASDAVHILAAPSPRAEDAATPLTPLHAADAAAAALHARVTNDLESTHDWIVASAQQRAARDEARDLHGGGRRRHAAMAVAAGIKRRRSASTRSFA